MKVILVSKPVFFDILDADAARWENRQPKNSKNKTFGDYIAN